MASNQLPDPNDELFNLAQLMIGGCNAIEAAVGLKQTTESDLQTVWDAATAAVLTYETSVVAEKAATADQSTADNNGKTYLTKAKNLFVIRYGDTWNEDWLPTGFPDQSTGIPRTIAGRQALLMAVGAYFTANPTHENAPLGVTAAQALTLGGNLAAQENHVGAADSDRRQKTT
jgi:hypothetical protein